MAMDDTGSNRPHLAEWPYNSNESFAFGDRLRAALDAFGPLCVGIDPHPAILNELSLGDTLKGLEHFVDLVISGADKRVGIIKPQVAFFERFGSRGMAILEDLTQRARGLGLLVIADAKRGDIDTTLQGYADAWLRPDSPFYCDALTLSPYLGVNSLKPAFATAFTNGKGLFVLAATSNPEAAELQQSFTSKNTRLSSDVASQVAEWNLRGKVLEYQIARGLTGISDEDLSHWRSTGYFDDYVPHEFLTFTDAVRARWIRARLETGANPAEIAQDLSSNRPRVPASREVESWERSVALAPTDVLKKFASDNDSVIKLGYWGLYDAVVGAARPKLGPFGVVVGATIDPIRVQQTLSDLAVGDYPLPILAPGFGAQGAELSDIKRIFGSRSSDVVANVSRAILRHGLSGIGRSIDELNAELTAVKSN